MLWIFFFSLFLNTVHLFLRSYSTTTIVLIFAIFHSLFTSMIWKGHWGTGNEKNHASKSLVWNSSKKNHSRFFGFLLCRKKLPIVEREREIPLFFFKKDSRHWLYAILQQNRKVSLTGNENLASNEALRLKQPLYLRLHDTPNRAKTIFQTQYFFK